MGTHTYAKYLGEETVFVAEHCIVYGMGITTLTLSKAQKLNQEQNMERPDMIYSSSSVNVLHPCVATYILSTLLLMVKENSSNHLSLDAHVLQGTCSVRICLD
mgnify:FL=1